MGEAIVDERVAKLKELWAAGLSCSRIAAALGGFPHSLDGGRNAVISKIHRLKLPQPEGKKTTQATVRAGYAAPRVRPAPPPRRNQSNSLAEKLKLAESDPGLAKAFIEPSDGVGITLMELKSSSCRWPKGDPLEEGFLFCGDPSADLDGGRPYCPFHSRKAYDRTATTRSGQRSNVIAQAAE